MNLTPGNDIVFNYMNRPESSEFHVELLINSTGALPKEVIAQIVGKTSSKIANPSIEEKDLDPPPSADEVPIFTRLPTQIMENRPRINAAEFLADFKARVRFSERDGRLQIVRDLIGMVRRLPHGVETYEEKLKKEEAKGKSEAASYGIGRLGDQEFVLFATHWDFFTGTLGVVMGEKFVKACDLATRKKLPLVAVYSSAGARQQENFPSLVQMPRMVNAISNYKDRTNQPYIGVLLHQVWGGISASSVPLSDFTVALEGTNFGFSGPVVIETYQHKKVPQGSQSVEAHSLNRNVDVLVRDKDELLRWLGGLFSLTSMRHRGLTEADLEGFLQQTDEIMSFAERFPFGKPRFSSLLGSKSFSQVPLDEFAWEAVNTKDLYERFLALRNNPNRVDSEYLIRHCFEDVVPLYNGLITEDRINYPAIIGAIGRIGRQPFFIVGNQPSYQLFGERVIKDPASPAPADFWWAQRALKAAARWGLPAVCFTDTLGAKPTLDAEDIGQFRAIAESIDSGIRDNKNPVITIITGVLGSGGGLSTAPMRDHIAMLENAMVFVAEPVSATSILYSQADPEVSLVRETIASMKPTATDQRELGLIDAVINEPFGGSWIMSLATAAEVRKHIGKTFLYLHNLRGRLRLGNRRIRHLRGLELKQ